jgi:hypothetical protein
MGIEKKKRVGIYLSPGIVIDNPDYLTALRDELGLNLVILGYSGELPPEVVKESPFDGTPPTDECIHSLVAKHVDGQPVDTTEFDQVRGSVGPGFGKGNEAEFRRANQVIHDAGMDMWICGGSWTQRALMFCPSNEATNHWFEAAYVHMATRYGIEGLDLSHARYPMGSMPRGLFSCACDNCARAAADMGYDMQKMVAALHAGHKRLASIDAKLLAGANRKGMGPFDYMQMLDMPSGIIDWFRFRAALLGKNLKRFRDTVHGAAGPNFIFGTDTYPASLSMFMGHNHAAWAEFSDFASPLVSHIYQFVVLTLVGWAQFLQELNPGLSEADALHIVYNVTGYDGLGLPDSEAGFNHEDNDKMVRSIPLKDIILHDLIKARLSLPEHLPSYPIIHGEGWPLEDIRGIMAGAEQAGHDGIIFQGTAELVNFELK